MGIVPQQASPSQGETNLDRVQHVGNLRRTDDHPRLLEPSLARTLTARPLSAAIWNQANC